MKKIILVGIASLLALSLSAQLLPERPVEPINWWQPVEFPWSAHKTDTITVYIIGDIMSHQSQIDGGLKYGFSTFLNHIARNVESADLAIGNMEYTLAGPPYTGYPSFCAPDAYTLYLRDIGFDVLLTANNHILDKGYRGLNRTFAVLDTLKGVQYTGMSRTPKEDKERYPLIVEVKGIRIAIINFTYGTNTKPSKDWPKINRIDRADILAAINRAKEAEADLILAFPHWGIEYKFKHNQSQESLAKFMVENGVHAVIGGHPHYVQDMEWMGDVPVIYSLGDAVSNMDGSSARTGLAVTLKIALETGEAPRILPPLYEFLWNSRPGEVENTHSALPVREFLAAPERWRNKDAYQLMKNAYYTVRKESGIHEEDTETGSR
ncbi:MAG: CapA family protein [Bacteroidales bacterium]|nr:CapA family protein [Bacteroidales bacterium]